MENITLPIYPSLWILIESIKYLFHERYNMIYNKDKLSHYL